MNFSHRNLPSSISTCIKPKPKSTIQTKSVIKDKNRKQLTLDSFSQGSSQSVLNSHLKNTSKVEDIDEEVDASIPSFAQFKTRTTLTRQRKLL